MAPAIKFLTTGEARHKSSFLQRIYLDELIHIPVDDKTTFGNLCDQLEEKFENDPVVLPLVHEWIESQSIGMDEDDQRFTMAMPVLDIIPDPGVNYFAIFDIVPTK